MRHKIYAMLLSLLMLAGAMPLSALAQEGNLPVGEDAVGAVTIPEAAGNPIDSASPSVLSSLDLNFGEGSIAINGDTATVNSTPKSKANAYVIKGAQGGNTLSILNATVPVTIAADVKADAITSSSTVTIEDGKNVAAPSITDKSGVRHPSIVTVPNAANAPVQVTVQQQPLRARMRTLPQPMTTSADGKLYLWGLNGTYHITVSHNGVNYPYNLAAGSTGSGTVTPAFSSGSGTQNDPYIIASQSDLSGILLGDAGAGKYYKLNTNLALSAPIGKTDGSEPFYGVFDGNGNQVNLSMNSVQGDFAGMFAALGSGAQVKNLALVGNVSSNGAYAGSLAGMIWKNNSTAPIVSNVFSSAAVTAAGANGAAGGIAGRVVGGELKNIYSTGAVKGTLYAGGISGLLEQGKIENAYATAPINAIALNGAAGGIAGASVGGSVRSTIALNPSVSGGNAGRILGVSSNASLALNSAWQYMPVKGSYPTTNVSINDINGESIPYATITSASLYDRFTERAQWNIANGQLATLKSSTGAAFAAPQSAAIPPNLSYTPPPSGGSGGGGGGNDYEPPYSEVFWDNLLDDIDDARSGDRIKFNTYKLDNMPTSILKELKGKNITLEITHNRDKIIINGKRMHPIPRNRIFYQWDDLAQLYEKPPASSNTTSKPAVSSKPPVTPQPPVQPSTPPPAPVYPVAPPPPAASSSAAESSSSVSESQPEESEEEFEIIAEESKPEELEADAQPEKPKRSMVPLIVAGVVIVLALAGAGAVVYYYYRRRPEDFYNMDDK